MVFEMTNRPPMALGAPLRAHWEGLTQDMRVWESFSATGEYY